MHLFSSPIAILVPFIGGIVLFVRGFRGWRERRLILNTPRSHIRSMPMGLVEITGAAEPRSALTAPFSQHPCVFWELDISTRNKNGWSVVHRSASGHPFFLSDGTGVALVYPEGAECRLCPGVEEVCTGPLLPPCYSEYIHDNHLALASVWSLGQLRFRERIVEEQGQVFVMGTAMPRTHALTVSDADAMQATGTDGGPARIQTLDEATVAVMRRGENEPTFIISQKSERDLTLDLGIHAAAQLVGGPLLTLFALGWWLISITSTHGLH
ncbi:MAG: hypothetical protein HYR73_07060 [Candidatus Eisenbacteria bacterium]|nr:hypothetical protein [Candidatus Eisenbacteria bacterium]